jgi:vancomycin resistance protein VanW
MRIIRHIKDLLSRAEFSKTKGEELPVVVYRHNSLIRRRLGNVDMRLQENKAVNLSLAAPRLNRILIRPNETFSFWRLAGRCSARKGYKEGLTISSGKTSKGIGGGMCQFTNLIHWLVLHSPLDITEHHHHDGIDIFPDYGRQVPFGCGTSIVYNYLDYQFKNNTDSTFQFIFYTNGTHLCGELRASKPQELSYHISEEDAHFVKLSDGYYRRNKIVRRVIDKRTGNELKSEIIKQSNAKVLYSEEFISKELLRV